jgi:UTP--glucose-1-phosphate uridylyltransferase
MQKIITKAVIPCGGMGTRFLPITKAVPKEILPVIDTPVLGHIVAEAVDSGITDILIILGKGKDAIREYFTPNPGLIKTLEDKGNFEYAEILRKIGEGAKISFKTQEKPLGSGDAVLYAEDFTGGEAFALSWGDDLIYSERPVIGQLIKAYDSFKCNILGVQKVETDDIVKYGVADTHNAKESAARAYKCFGIIEKPPLNALPSRLAALGRYILTDEVYGFLRSVPLGKNGELQLTDALDVMAKNGSVYAYDFVGRRYDLGDKFGAVCATIEYAMRSKNLGGPLKAYLSELMQ